MAIGGFLTGPGGGGSGGTTTIGIAVQTNIDQSIRQFNQLNQTINNFAARTNSSLAQTNRGFLDFNRHIIRINGNVVALGLALTGLAYKGKEFFERGARMEMFQARMEGLAGSLSGAKKEIADLVGLAETVPFKLDVLTRGFIKMKAAGIDPIIGKDGSGPLKSMVDAMAAFGGDSDHLDRAITALMQMAGKGVVSMEELRQQLGEAIPTALRIAAREMNMTVAQFVAKVSTAQISWEEFAAVFFKGLDKNYGGSAARLMKTFTGSVAQLDTQMDLLAKTIFVDTGTMRYFTAAVQMGTAKIKELRQYLQTAEGQAWIDSLWEGFKQIAIYAAQAVTPVFSVVKIIGELAGIAADLTSGLPAEIVGGGILGYVLFGKAGIVPGAMVGSFGQELTGVFAAVAEFTKSTKAMFDPLVGGDVVNSIAIGGLLGLWIAGPKGMLIGAVSGALVSLKPEIESWLEWYARKMFTAMEYLKLNIYDIMSGNTGDIDRIVQERIDAWKRLMGGVSTTEGSTIELKVDLPEVDVTNAASNVEFLRSKFKLIEQSVKEAGAAAGKALNQISEDTIKAANKIELDVGGFDRIYSSKESAIAHLEDYKKTVSAKIAEIQDYIQSQQNSKMKIMMEKGVSSEQFDAHIAKYEEMLRKTVEIRDAITTNLDQVKSMADGNIATGVSDLLTEIQNFASTIDTSFESIDQMKSKMDEWAVSIENYKFQLQDASLTEEQRTEIMSALTQAQQELAGAMDLVNQKAQASGPVFEENAVRNQQLANSVAELQRRADALNLGTKMEMSAQQIASAQGRIDSLLGAIQLKIAQVQQQADKGLISPTTAQTTISNLERIAAQAEATKARLVSSAQQADAAWQQLGSSILSAVEGAIGDAIYGLVTKTKSMKEVMVDLWNSITRAVANYLAKLIMGGLFGGAGGGGGLFGGMFGGGGGGGGGLFAPMQMMGDNRQQMAPQFVRRQDDARRISGPAPMTINISAIDATGVQQLFMKHGSSLHASINHRMRLNHQ